MKWAVPLVPSLHCVADGKWVASGVEQSQYSHWSEQWVCCVAICTEVVEVAAFIDHTDRCRPQAQHGLNAWEAWACGHMVSVQPGQARRQTPASCREQVILYLPLWQRANNDFSWSLLFSKSRFRLLCFSLSAAFHRQAFVGFCVFSSFVSRSVVSLPVLRFYLTNLSTLWYLLNNSLPKNHSELLLGCIKWNQRQQSVTGRPTTSE